MNNDEWRAFIAENGSTFELLFRAARIVNEFALSELNSQMSIPVRPSHTALFPHISAEGVRITEIAQKLGVSKQAIAKRIDELEEMGTVEKVPDPTDGRARLVRFNTEAVAHGLAHLRTLEDDCSEEIGREKMVALADALQALVEYVHGVEST